MRRSGNGQPSSEDKPDWFDFDGQVGTYTILLRRVSDVFGLEDVQDCVLSDGSLHI